MVLKPVSLLVSPMRRHDGRTAIRDMAMSACKP